MVILHFASIILSPFSGVSIAVPHHIVSQSKNNIVGFVNIKNIKFSEINNQFDFASDFNIGKLSEPFNHPDIVIFHEVYNIEYLKIYKQCIKFGIPYVIIPHGELSNMAQKKKRLKKTIANVIFFNKFIKNANAIQYLSKTECDESFFGKKKIIGTNGVEMPRKTKEHFSNNSVIFTYIGRLDLYHKGLDLLINAIASKKDYLIKNNCVFNLYGPNIENRHNILNELIVAKNLQALVHVYDGIKDIEKEKVLLDTDIFIQTSRFEGMPLGILEALAYGIPCLITEGTTLTSFVKNDLGWSCKTNCDSIAEAIVDSISDRNNWMNKSKLSIKKINDYFSWDAVTEQNILLYKNIVVKED